MTAGECIAVHAANMDMSFTLLALISSQCQCEDERRCCQTQYSLPLLKGAVFRHNTCLSLRCYRWLPTRIPRRPPARTPASPRSERTSRPASPTTSRTKVPPPPPPPPPPRPSTSLASAATLRGFSSRLSRTIRPCVRGAASDRAASHLFVAAQGSRPRSSTSTPRT